MSHTILNNGDIAVNKTVVTLKKRYISQEMEVKRNSKQRATDIVGKYKKKSGDFPDDPVAKTLHSQCRVPGFNPYWGNEIPPFTTKESCMLQWRLKISRATAKTQHSQTNKYFLKKKSQVPTYLLSSQLLIKDV